MTLAAAAGLDPVRDFRHADLSGLDLRGDDLRGFDLRNARLRNTLIEKTQFNDTVGPEQKAEAILLGDGRPPGPPPQIVMIALGRRGVEVARNIQAPDWYPSTGSGDVGAGIYGVSDDEDVGIVGAARSILRAPLGIVPSLLRFDIVVVIADDEVAQDMTRGGGTRYPGLDSPGIRLLVPALPKDQPSSILSGNAPLPGPFHAVVDSSVARSPWWSGNESRALDRRIADIAVGAAMLVDENHDLKARLSDSYETATTPLMTYGLRLAARDAQTRDAIQTGIASEAIGLGGATEMGSPDPSVLGAFVFHSRWTRQRPRDADRGLVELRRLDRVDVEPFLRSAAEGALEQDASQTSVHPAPALTRLEVPPELRDRLKYPDHVVGLQGSGGFPLAVLAETPDLDLAQAASALGWRVARYTNTEFVEEVLHSAETTAPPKLPTEIGLYFRKGWIRNVGLATRGVDPRDVVRLRGDLLDQVRHFAPDLLERSRLFRAAYFPDPKAEPVRLLRTSDLSEWLSQTQEAPEELLERLQVERLAKPTAQKRPSDLKAAWTLPDAEDTRFVIADGPIPVRVDKIARDEAPAQSLFFVDGDAAVPALLQSKVFDAWARATASRSTSWMEQRFSVGRTFETFPITQPFRLGRGAGGVGSLRLDRSDERLAPLADAWLGTLPASRAGTVGDEPLNTELAEVRAELDALILRAYGVPSDAEDIDIMKRLLSWLDS